MNALVAPAPVVFGSAQPARFAPATAPAASTPAAPEVTRPGLLGWLGAALLTALMMAGIIAALVAEYAALWAVLVAPWFNHLPSLRPW